MHLGVKKEGDPLVETVEDQPTCFVNHLQNIPEVQIFSTNIQTTMSQIGTHPQNTHQPSKAPHDAPWTA